MNEPAIDSALSLNLPIAAGATTDVGQREENQDCITGFIAPCGAVYLVADGMGGHSGGAEASRMVADGMRRHLLSLPQSTPVGDALSLAARLTNVELLTRSSGDPNLAGMGSTVAIALVRAFENRMELIAAHAGDSRVYLHRAGQLALLTRDDTQVQWMVDRHLIDEARARTHPDSSVLTKAMGHSADLDIDVSEPIPLLEGDGILLCSDGLSGFASSEEINRVILQTPQPAACARELVKLALDKGSDDNISVQFLRIGTTPPAGVTIPIDSSQPRDSRPAASRVRLASGLAIALALALAAFVTWRSGFFPAPFASPVTLRIEGSTTVGDELVPALVKAFLEHEGAAKIEVIRRSANKAKIEIGGVLPGQSRQVFSVIANGSANAFTALAANNAQVGMASRRIRDDEAKNLSGLGDMKSPACEHIVALDGIAIVVNVGNAVQSLTKVQVASVFQGKVQDWGQLGGRPGPIHIYGRDSASGTFDSFVTMVLGGGNQALLPNATIKATGEEIAQAVSSDPAGIGYSSLAQVKGVKPLAISEGSGATALMPSAYTVATEDYILSRRLYLYIPASPSASARSFIAFATGREGQAIVKNIGFVPPDRGLAPPSIPKSAPPEYTSIVGNRRKLLTFRFEPDSFALDGRAMADIDQTAKVLRQRGITNGIYALGFTDNRESCKQSGNLSEQRAQAVRSRFITGALQAQARGFCAQAPVADDTSEQGRQRNRRVEVWVP